MPTIATPTRVISLWRFDPGDLNTASINNTKKPTPSPITWHNCVPVAGVSAQVPWFWPNTIVPIDHGVLTKQNSSLCPMTIFRFTFPPQAPMSPHDIYHVLPSQAFYGTRPIPIEHSFLQTFNLIPQVLQGKGRHGPTTVTGIPKQIK